MTSRGAPIALTTMLRLDLFRLDREGSVRVEAEIPPDHELWDKSDLAFGGPVRVRLRAIHAGTGEVVVRGTVEAELEQECRRCLEPVTGRVELELTMVFAASAEPGAEEDDGDVRSYEADAGELDLKDAVREELILAIDPFVVCDPECKGLCPRCGANLNEEACDCTGEEADPRWDALRSLES